MRARRRGVLSFFMGMIVGILLLVGAVAGFGYWAYQNITIKTVEGWMGSEIIKGKDEESEALRNKNISQLIAFAGTLTGANSPLTVNWVKKTFGLEIPTEVVGLDLSGLYDTQILQLMGADFLGTIRFAEHCPLLDAIGIPAIAQRRADGTLQTLQDLLDLFADYERLTLGDVMQFSEGDRLYEMRDWKLGEIQTKILTEPLKTFIPIDANSPKLLQKLGEASMNTVASELAELTVRDVIEVPQGDTGLLSILMSKEEFAGAKLSEMGGAFSNVIMNLTVSEFVEQGLGITVADDTLLGQFKAQNLTVKAMFDQLAALPALPSAA